MTMKNRCYPFINTPLPYGYNALKPFIDEKTMWLHHSRHLQNYIDNLNKLLKENPELQSWSLEELVGCYSWLPRTLGTAVRNQAGGVYNHRFFFEGMAPGGISLGDGVLAQEMNRTFGGTEGWKERMKEAAMSVFGSGYAWLVWGKNGLEIRTTANQDSPVEPDVRPLLNIDVWEHAYYLKHYNVRAAYIEDWFQVINWHAAQRRLTCGGMMGCTPKIPERIS